MTIATALGAGALLTKIADRVLSRPDRERDADKSMREELRGEIAAMRERVAVLESRVADLTRERDEHRASAMVSAAERDIARRHVTDLEAENAQLREANESLLRDTGTLRAAAEDLRAEVASLRRELVAVRGDAGEREDAQDDAATG